MNLRERKEIQKEKIKNWKAHFFNQHSMSCRTAVHMPAVCVNEKHGDHLHLKTNQN